MKLETGVVVAKAVCVTFGGACAALITGAAQWVDSDVSPSRMAWCIIVAGTLAGGFNALGGFLSSAFSKYLDNRNGNGKPPEPPKTP